MSGFRSYLEQRDSESSLDPTLFRMYPSADGLSPDPARSGTGSILNPQSLNRYAYVLNNPTNLIDPLGLQDCSQAPDPRACGEQLAEQWRNFADQMSRGAWSANSSSAECILDGAPVPCETLFNMINAGWIEGIQSATMINGGVVLEGTTPHPEGADPIPWTVILPFALEPAGPGSFIGPAPPPQREGPTQPDTRPYCADIFTNNLFGHGASAHAQGQSAEQVLVAGSQAYAAKALEHQMKRGLVVPLRSSIVRSLLLRAGALGIAAEMVPWAGAAYAILPAVRNSATASLKGECKGVF